ncbi:hypothetical protein COBT_002221, partial [Conglomerata obtusa]
MKTISFIFTHTSYNLPQLEWAIKNYIQPYIHHILLIYILPDRLYPINDPPSMLAYHNIYMADSIRSKKAVNVFFGSVEKRLRQNFDESVSISKL